MAVPSRSFAKASRNQSPESFESLNRRIAAAHILQSYEELSWQSFHRCESLTQTRLHFQNIVAGFTPEDEVMIVDWEEDWAPHPPRVGEESRHSRKGKERAVSGSVGGAGIGMGVGNGSPGGKGKAGDKAPTIGNGSPGGGGSQTKKKRRSGVGSGGS